MFKYKQSSLWFLSRGSSLLRYSKRPLGIRSSAAVSFEMFGSLCGHTGPILSDTRTPSHGEGARVGLKRFDWTGGVA